MVPVLQVRLETLVPQDQEEEQEARDLGLPSLTPAAVKLSAVKEGVELGQ